MKKVIPDGVAILLFVLISFLYFLPSVMDGRILIDHDASAGVGAGQEAKEYYEENGERTRWTNSLFGGMPTYQISPSYSSTDTLKGVEKVYRLFLPEYVWLVFVMLLGFYLLLRAFEFSPPMAALGGVLWAFSSYFFILIAAGHLWKFITLAYIPPTIAGIVWTYRKKYILGGAIAALFASLQLISNHIQMTYYFLFVILFIVIAYFIKAYKEGELKAFTKSTLVLMGSALIAVAINSSNLYHTYNYSQESTRGKSELTLNSESNNNKGVDKEYITQWSYGIGETLTLLIPNSKGGASKPLISNEAAMEKANPQFYNLFNQFTQYFGDQPFTAGPVYVGAFVLFLFIVAIFIVKGPIKWALLGATVFSILLSWGKNFMPLTSFFIDYIPLYDKFRAVSSILVIAEFTIPLLALFGLRQLIKDKDNIFKYKKPLLIGFICTAGVALIAVLAPQFVAGSFVTGREIQALSQAPIEIASPFMDNLVEVRSSIVKSDAWRSFLIILVGCFILYIAHKKRIKNTVTITLLLLLCLIDLWNVNKRYLNDGLFVPKTNLTHEFKPNEADKYILNDKDPNFRVLNFTSNTFNENHTSYWHKSIGGYNAAKLRRYQELIDLHIQGEMQNIIGKVTKKEDEYEPLSPMDYPVLNMLNTKYFILGKDKNGVLENPFRAGNAWFVEDLLFVNNANEEITKLGDINPLTTAVVNNEFKDKINSTSNVKPGNIDLIKYEPNQLTYKVNSETGGTALFSEIFYPGWKAQINGKDIPLIRANYILRGIDLPKGNYELQLSFKPTSLKVTETIAYIGLFSLLLLFLYTGFLSYRKYKQ